MAWFAVYTKSRCEKQVAWELEAKGIEAYCPINKVKKQWSDRTKWVEEPLFRSYVFVNIDYVKQSAEVRKARNVVNFVYWLGKPAVIQANEIDEIKSFLTDFVNVEVIGKSVKVGDFITINSGVFEGKIAQVKSFKNKNEVRLYIESLGYELVAQLADHVKK
jgi:transcription antitermination factor NusG